MAGSHMECELIKPYEKLIAYIKSPGATPGFLTMRYVHDKKNISCMLLAYDEQF